MVQLFIVPSKQVLISFGKNAANYVSTWFYNNDQINVMFKYTPQYKKRRGRKFFTSHFQYTKEVNELDIPIVEKFINTILWHKLHKNVKYDWIGEYDGSEYSDGYDSIDGKYKEDLENIIP